MKKLETMFAQPTFLETEDINKGIAAIRETLGRFKTANADATGGWVPIVIVQVTEAETHWRLDLTGRAPATGRTLGEAYVELEGNSDAAFLRTRARAMRDAAARLEREAAAMEMEGAAAPATAYGCTFAGMPCVAINARGNSLVLDAAARPEHKMRILWALEGGRWRVQIYENGHAEIDCGQIAKNFGGGGHTGAAGFILGADRNPLDLFRPDK